MAYNLPGYPKIYALGHRDIEGIFDKNVLVQEKLDGSQFSFKISNEGYLFRSKGADVYADNPPKMFAPAVREIMELDLNPFYLYRGECLTKNKHNALNYDRTPRKFVALFDIQLIDGDQYFLAEEALAEEANRLGLETVPTLFKGHIDTADELKILLETESFLGGPRVEGVVVKNYDKFTHMGHIMMGKFVSEHFKEVHGGEWRKANPNKKDMLENLIHMFKTEARWAKAVQHLNDLDQLDHSPKDIGKVLKEIQRDVKEEEEATIRDLLFSHFWPGISRGIISGFPEWYKDSLLESSFMNKDVDKLLDEIDSEVDDAGVNG